MQSASACEHAATPTGRGMILAYAAADMRRENLIEHVVRRARAVPLKRNGFRVNADRLERPRRGAKPIFTTEWFNNTVVTNGKTLIQQRLFGLASSVALSAIGVGTDPAASAVGQAQLNPVTAGSVYLQAFDATPTISGQTVTYQITVATANGNFQWQEFATFNGTTNGTSTMYNRIAPVGPYTKTNAVSLVVILQSIQN